MMADYVLKAGVSPPGDAATTGLNLVWGPVSSIMFQSIVNQFGSATANQYWEAAQAPDSPGNGRP